VTSRQRGGNVRQPIEPEPESFQVSRVQTDWSEEDLLRQDAVFYLHEIAPKLDIPTAELKREAADIESAGRSSWDTVGLRRAFRFWLVRMQRFADHYRKAKRTRVREVRVDWDANELLSQSGLFYLADVCDKLPFSPSQIRHQARRARLTGRTFGVWKDPARKAYIVQMEVFSEWLKGLWRDRNIGIEEKP